jgi:hypothetical protein
MTASHAIAAKHDFDGDRHDDVIWRHATTGADVEWGAGQRSHSLALATVTNPQWEIVGTGDFDGDGRSDLLWRSAANGANTIWRSADASTRRAIAALSDTRWRVVGVGDFEGDGRSDILWAHPTLGFTIWSAGIASRARRINSFQVIAIGDLDGDGRDDLVGRTTLYPTFYRFFAWSGADETHTLELGLLSSNEMANLSIQAVGDFDGDGRADLFWRNVASGRNFAWLGGKPANGFAIARVPDLNWYVAASGDFDHDGKSDLLWRNRARSGVSLWYAADAARGTYLGVVSDLWAVAR